MTCFDVPTGRRQPTAADGGLSVAAPSTSRNDERIDIEVTGASPGATVTFRASLTDDDGVEWSSEATFTADEDGTVGLGGTAPGSGSYEGVAPMGWLWSMSTGADRRFAALGSQRRVPVEIRAETEDGVVSPTVVRELYADGVTREPVDADGLVGDLFLPPGDGPHPGVLELHGSGGPSGERVPRLLASAGFAVCSLRYFGDPDPIPDELARVPLGYVDDAAAWLGDHPAVGGRRLGLVGASRGGELALLLGARHDWAGAVVTFAGSGVVWDTPGGTPAWVADGEPVAHLSGEGPPDRTEDGRVIPRPVLERGLDAATPGERRAATVPVEAVDGPVLLLSGGADPVWPARRLSAIVVARAERHDAAHRVEHLTYDGVGHLIPVPYAPVTGVERGDVRAAATARAGADAWPAVLETLRRGLSPSATAD